MHGVNAFIIVLYITMSLLRDFGIFVLFFMSGRILVDPGEVGLGGKW